MANNDIRTTTVVGVDATVDPFNGYPRCEISAHNTSTQVNLFNHNFIFDSQEMAAEVLEALAKDARAAVGVRTGAITSDRLKKEREAQACICTSSRMPSVQCVVHGIGSKLKRESDFPVCYYCGESTTDDPEGEYVSVGVHGTAHQSCAAERE